MQTDSEAQRAVAEERHHLRRDLAWLLAVKFAALGLLWLLFFSGAHRSPVDAAEREPAARRIAP